MEIIKKIIFLMMFVILLAVPMVYPVGKVMAQQVLSVREIVDVLVSFADWQKIGECND